MPLNTVNDWSNSDVEVGKSLCTGEKKQWRLQIRLIYRCRSWLIACTLFSLIICCQIMKLAIWLQPCSQNWPYITFQNQRHKKLGISTFCSLQYTSNRVVCSSILYHLCSLTPLCLGCHSEPVAGGRSEGGDGGLGERASVHTSRFFKLDQSPSTTSLLHTACVWHLLCACMCMYDFV